jgi:hypothetical protein
MMTMTMMSVYDLQALHSVCVANLTYGQLITSPNKTPQNMVDAYHFVSIEWHRLLFPESIQLLSNRTDDPDDSYRSFMSQLRRYCLKMFLNWVDVVYCGNQKEVLEAVVCRFVCRMERQLSSSPWLLWTRI